MLSPTLPTVFALASLTTAFPQLATPDFKLDLERRAGHPYQLNPVGSVRAPCPGMNTLANHGERRATVPPANAHPFKALSTAQDVALLDKHCSKASSMPSTWASTQRMPALSTPSTNAAP